MNAEALIGTVLGTCTLQQLIGQGGMGAVYLAQQSRPRRQVAVKVLLPATTLKPHHLAAFLERFRRETDAAASLEHPNIMPVYEYGERNGLAYLVMPYISGGTLRDVMEREGQMALPKVVNYLEQIAAALDFAHTRGVIHRDIKPANILLTPEGRLLLTDFGLVKVIAGEGRPAQTRLTGAGAPVGTPDYMSPEQVIGDDVDGRADLYSLGIILFQMVTGTTPFQGETPMQIAAQQLHAPPPAPRRFRPDLPAAAEQVILKALAKRPPDRYPNGLELATAFRLALAPAEMQLYSAQSLAAMPAGPGGSGVYTPRGLFDPQWQPAMPVNGQNTLVPTGDLPVPAAPARSTGLLSRTGMFPRIGSSQTGSFTAANANNSNPATPTGVLSAASGMHHPPAQGFNEMSPSLNPMMRNAESPTSAGVPPGGLSQLSPSLRVMTGSLQVPNPEQSSAGTIKLTGPVKVVQVPVAPGQYVTGLLPVAPAAEPAAPQKSRRLTLQKILSAVVLVILLAGGILGVLFVRMHLGQLTTSHKAPAVATPGQQATKGAQPTGTARTDIILSDPLSQNIHNFPVGSTPTRIYQFKDGAYHITNLGKDGIAVVLQVSLPTMPLGYSLTMEEIKGDDTSINNSFGMILRYNQQAKGNQVISTFYSFEVVNTNGGEYRFYKYDSSQANPWTEVWHQVFGHEFHQGQGPHNVNTFKVFASGSAFTFTVNGHKIGTLTDGSYKLGNVGMLVNLQGTEVAFSNLLITTD